jgi:hypothetical protein
MVSEDDNAFLGVARWCLQDYVAASDQWRKGTKAPYAKGGICTQTPLLLIAGSILRPGLLARAEAEEILRSKLLDHRTLERAEHWPATLGRMVLGTIPKEAMAAYWIGNLGHSDSEKRIMPDRQWLTAFYDAVLELGKGAMTVSDFRQLMHRSTAHSNFEGWALEDWRYLISNPEFYVARFEGAAQPAA